MPQKIHAIYVLSPQISYDTKEQARTFDTLVLFVPYNEPYLSTIDTILLLAKSSKWWQQCNLRKFKWRRYTLEEDILLRRICAKKNLHHRDHAALSDKRLLTQLSDLPAHFLIAHTGHKQGTHRAPLEQLNFTLIAHRGHTQCPSTAMNTSSQ